MNFTFNHQIEPYATHQPVLYECIKQTRGSILELGCGFNSTALIDEVAGNRFVCTVDHNLEWLQRFMDKENKKPRTFAHVKSWGDISSFAQFEWSVVFIDQGDWQSRLDSLGWFHQSEFIVLHDSDYLERELGANFNKMYQYVKTFMPLEPYPYHTGPPTTVFSNKIDITKLDIDYRNYQ